MTPSFCPGTNLDIELDTMVAINSLLKQVSIYVILILNIYSLSILPQILIIFMLFNNMNLYLDIHLKILLLGIYIYIYASFHMLTDNLIELIVFQGKIISIHLHFQQYLDY